MLLAQGAGAGSLLEAGALDLAVTAFRLRPAAFVRLRLAAFDAANLCPASGFSYRFPGRARFAPKLPVAGFIRAAREQGHDMFVHDLALFSEVEFLPAGGALSHL